jgi:hypothetical protein
VSNERWIHNATNIGHRLVDTGLVGMGNGRGSQLLPYVIFKRIQGVKRLFVKIEK